jgi:hypothetical protein
MSRGRGGPQRAHISREGSTPHESIRCAVAVGLGADVLLVAGAADAQYRYTGDDGISKVVQYKLDVPATYRDAAVWIGPTGIGKPALSEAAQETKRRDDIYRGSAAQQQNQKVQQANELERQRLWRQRQVEPASR